MRVVQIFVQSLSRRRIRKKERKKENYIFELPRENEFYYLKYSYNNIIEWIIKNIYFSFNVLFYLLPRIERKDNASKFSRPRNKYKNVPATQHIDSFFFSQNCEIKLNYNKYSIINVGRGRRKCVRYVDVFRSHTHLGEQLQSEGTKSARCYG